MNSFHEYVRKIAEDLRAAKGLPLGEAASPEPKKQAADAPVAMIFSPHPDDECVMGGLPLRLARESGFRVVNVPVTLGSRSDRRAERKRELGNACKYLGFGTDYLSDEGLSNISPEGRERDAANWDRAERRVAELLTEYRPKVILFPHQDDAHPTHIGTGLLVKDSLRRRPPDHACVAIETEYWRPMDSPNLMVELDERAVGDLVTALSFHKGEVARNPFHLTLPAWLIDNVRRGSEVAGSPGAESKRYLFAALYRVSEVRGGTLEPAFDGSKFVSVSENPFEAFSIRD